MGVCICKYVYCFCDIKLLSDLGDVVSKDKYHSKYIYVSCLQIHS